MRPSDSWTASESMPTLLKTMPCSLHQDMKKQALLWSYTSQNFILHCLDNLISAKSFPEKMLTNTNKRIHLVLVYEYKTDSK